MKVTSCLFLVLIYVCCTTAQDCSLGSLPGVENVQNVNDTTYTIFQVTNMVEVYYAEVVACSSKNPDWIYVNVNLTIPTALTTHTQNMDKFEAGFPSGAGNSGFLCFALKVQCLSFLKDYNIIVQDTNNHRPEFIDQNGKVVPEYIYVIPMPMPAGIDLTLFNQTIVAQDIDISNAGITFTVTGNNSDDFKASSTKDQDDELNKKFIATLLTEKTLSYEQRSYTIVAKDSGGLESTAILTVQRSLRIRVDHPFFEYPYYSGQYVKATGSIINLPIITLLDAEGTVVTVEEKYANNFSATLVGNTVTLKVISPVDVENVELITFYLKASSTTSGISVKATINLQVLQI